MSRKKTYPIPDVNKTFFYGNVVSGRSMGDVVYLKSRKNYSFRLFLIFESGNTKIVQRSGYPDKILTRQKRDETLMQISKGTFVSFSYSVREFYDYWLYYHMIHDKHITYNTFIMYRNLIILHKISSKDLQRTAIGMITGSLRYAQSHNYLPYNIYDGLSAELRRKNISTMTRKRSSPVYSIEQISHLCASAGKRSLSCIFPCSWLPPPDYGYQKLSPCGMRTLISLIKKFPWNGS